MKQAQVLIMKNREKVMKYEGMSNCSRFVFELVFRSHDLLGLFDMFDRSYWSKGFKTTLCESSPQSLAHLSFSIQMLVSYSH